MEDVIDLLSKRGLIEQKTDQNLKKILSKPMRFYIGFDPTSSSLHLGSLVGIIVLKWLQQFGHTPYIVLGGATGRIGDPSGKSVERPLLTDENIRNNVSCLKDFFTKLFAHEKIKPVIIDNDEWFQDFNLVEFLRDIGKQFRLGPMLSKESVKTRLNTEEGISFTEFTYQILQAYDFYHLSNKHNVFLQVGGSDQWGNIVAGIELTRKLSKKALYGFTFPLLVGSDGKKFGKTEKGAIWLQEEKLSPFDFYQYLFRVSDTDVIRLMKMLTFIDLEEISKYEKMMQEKDYVPNTCQIRLAQELTRMIHGQKNLDIAEKTSANFAFGKSTKLTEEGLEQLSRDLPVKKYSSSQIVGEKFVEIAVKSGLTSSKSETVRLIKSGGAYLNNKRISEIDKCIENEDIIKRKYLLMGIGKKKKLLIEVSF